MHFRTPIINLTLIVFVVAVLVTWSHSFHLTILHTNDIHSRINAFNDRLKPCDSSVEPNCYGGVGRLATAVRRLRSAAGGSCLLLDAGDQFQGTRWYKVHKWRPIALLVNALGYDAMSLGNHEFDDGLAGLIPYLKEVKAPFISSNLNTTGTELDGYYREYKIFVVAGESVGLVGYVTPETARDSEPGGDGVRFSDEVAGLRRTVGKLRRAGVNKILALGHSGYGKDREICRRVPGVDVVVGGHTHSLLYGSGAGGGAPAGDEVHGPYPTVIRRGGAGSPCLVVQASTNAKYLGRLRIEFDDSGVATNWSGNPVLIDNTFPDDPSVIRLFRDYERRFAETDRVLARAGSPLDGRRSECRRAECTFGDLVADATVFGYEKRARGRGEPASTPQHCDPDSASPLTGICEPAVLAFVNSAVFRNFYLPAGEPLTTGDMDDTFPHKNRVRLIRLTGRHIREVLEHSVADYVSRSDDPSGNFLQISGFAFDFTSAGTEGDRVRNIRIKCRHCPTIYSTLDLRTTYDVLTISYLIGGGAGFGMIRDNYENHTSISYDESHFDTVIEYFKDHPTPIAQLEDRIKLVDQSE